MKIEFDSDNFSGFTSRLKRFIGNLPATAPEVTSKTIVGLGAVATAGAGALSQTITSLARTVYENGRAGFGTILKDMEITATDSKGVKTSLFKTPGGNNNIDEDTLEVCKDLDGIVNSILKHQSKSGSISGTIAMTTLRGKLKQHKRAIINAEPVNIDDVAIMVAEAVEPYMEDGGLELVMKAIG